ncbi:MAG: hypothetical protein GX265_05905 [Mollicutes bacterium]|nr:hypothetical protein [Mollicutes bacterium]
MKPIYIGDKVPNELLIGESVGKMQLFVNDLTSRNVFGVANEGICIKPAILKRAVLLNENFFAAEYENESQLIVNKDGKDLTLYAAHLVGPDYIISATNVNKEIGIKFDGTPMTNDELANIDRRTIQVFVNFKTSRYDPIDDILIQDSENYKDQEKNYSIK